MLGSSRDNLLRSQSQVSNRSGGMTEVAIAPAITLAIETGKNNNDELITIPKYQKNAAIYITIKLRNKNKKIVLVDKNNISTIEGKFYYTLFNIPIPSLYNLERGVENGQIMTRSGIWVKVLGKKDQVLVKGQDFYKNVKDEYIINLPIKRIFPPYPPVEVRTTIPLYIAVSIDGASKEGDKFTKKIEQNRQDNLVKSAVVDLLRDPENITNEFLLNNSHTGGSYFMFEYEGINYTVISQDSEVMHVWDETKDFHIDRKYQAIKSGKGTVE